MRFFTSCGFSSTSKPAIVALPAEGGRKQVSTRIVVVFPAPFGPRKPTIWPFSTSKEMSSTATVRAYRLVRPSTLIILIIQIGQMWLMPLGRDLAQNGLRQRNEMKFHHREGGKCCQMCWISCSRQVKSGPSWCLLLLGGFAYPGNSSAL